MPTLISISPPLNALLCVHSYWEAAFENDESAQRKIGATGEDSLVVRMMHEYVVYKVLVHRQASLTHQSLCPLSMDPPAHSLLSR